MNPGGTGKDRAVKYMLDACRRHPNFRSDVGIYEGTSGSTGIALAFQCNALGLQLHVVMPDDQANEKKVMLEKLGAVVTVVPSCAIANTEHYVNTARRLADSSKGIFVDQFENTANYLAHYEGTGPEIYEQRGGKLDAFVMSAGTGGTIAGVSRSVCMHCCTQISSPSHFIGVQISEREELCDPGGAGRPHGVQPAGQGAVQCVLHAPTGRAHHPQASLRLDRGGRGAGPHHSQFRRGADRHRGARDRPADGGHGALAAAPRGALRRLLLGHECCSRHPDCQDSWERQNDCHSYL